MKEFDFLKGLLALVVIVLVAFAFSTSVNWLFFGGSSSSDELVRVKVMDELNGRTWVRTPDNQVVYLEGENLFPSTRPEEGWIVRASMLERYKPFTQEELDELNEREANQKVVERRREFELEVAEKGLIPVLSEDRERRLVSRTYMEPREKDLEDRIDSLTSAHTIRGQTLDTLIEEYGKIKTELHNKGVVLSKLIDDCSELRSRVDDLDPRTAPVKSPIVPEDAEERINHSAFYFDAGYRLQQQRRILPQTSRRLGLFGRR